MEEAANSINCFTRSIYRWVQRPFPYKMTGGRPRVHLTGADQLLLSLCLFIYPDASIDEIAAFIYANGGGIYERPTISTRCNELGLSRKRSSKESYAAFSPSSLQKYRWFMTLPPPLGVSGISVDKFIDIDETSFYLKNITTRYGRSHTTHRARYPAHYSRCHQRVNVMFAVEAGSMLVDDNVDGSRRHPRRWCMISTNNIDQFIFGEFINSILSNIENHPAPNNVDNERILLWDNLSLHKTAYVCNMITNRESDHVFAAVDRPPYRPRLAPIEYMFYELSCELARRCNRTWDMDIMRQNIIEICGTIGRGGRLHSTFVHCGYPFN